MRKQLACPTGETVDGCGSPLLTDGTRRMGVLLWVLIIGCVAGTIARVLMPGPNRPKGFVLTIVLGVAGAFLATYIGHMLGMYRPGESAGFIGASVGALLILFIWNRLIAADVISDHGL
jgi:uncharacterized membrane protein YeaQ/YmgE (transglycosylase-associated protein family)